MTRKKKKKKTVHIVVPPYRSQKSVIPESFNEGLWLYYCGENKSNGCRMLPESSHKKGAA